MSGLSVPYGGFDCSLGHIVTANTRQQIPDLRCGLEALPFEQAPEVIPEDVPTGIRGFRAIGRALAGDAFPPASDAVNDHFCKEHAAGRRGFHAGLERRNQLHAEFAERELFETHIA